MDNFNRASVPSITLAALRGGSGKTIASLAITRALTNRGKRVAVFKKGPDYIDAAWLGRAARGNCYNLDPFLMSEDAIASSFKNRSFGAELAVIEGNRGLFDGVDVRGGFSTAQLARQLKSPVVLVADCTKVTRTMAAMIRGLMDFEKGVEIIGVILNRVAGKRHMNILADSIAKYTGLPVLGIIPRMKEDPLPMRHLGLTPADEYAGPEKALDILGKMAEENVDLDRLLELVDERCRQASSAFDILPTDKKIGHKTFVKIGIIRDSSFQFYYPENLEALEKRGASLVYLNAVSDNTIPEIDALYIGGGFPETQAVQLSANTLFRERLKGLIEAGLPVYAECGGLMYLGRNLVWKDHSYPMLQVLNWDFVLKRKPVGHGYTILELKKDSPFFKRGDVLKGHEFHYSQPVPVDNIQTGYFACQVNRGYGFDGTVDGFCYKNVFGTYTHIHALGNPKWSETMIEAAVNFKEKEKSLSLPQNFGYKPA